MAHIKKTKGRPKNPTLAGVSGHIGRTVVVKQYKHITVVANFPDMSRVKPSAKQKAKRRLFHHAVVHAKGVMRDPKEVARYAKRLKGKRNVFQAVISEYLRKAKE